MSLKDIAGQLDVSVSLVSKVLNDRMGTTGASKQVVQAIRRKAIELGYRKNTSALALVRGRHDVLGVFVHHHGTAGSGIAETMLNGIAGEAHRLQQKQFLDFFITASEFRLLCRSAHHGIMDGLIVAGVRHAELRGELLRIDQSGTPVVTIYDEQIDRSLPNVGIDEAEIARVATHHLIERGCRRIAHIRTLPSRFKGYRAALEVAGISSTPELVFMAGIHDFDHTTGRRAVSDLLGRSVEFDGLVAQSDQQAMGALHALMRAGKRVPDDVRVIGVDDSPYCEFSAVPLSSVSQNFTVRGQHAVRMLMDRIEGRDVASIAIEPELRIRASTH